MVRGSGKREQCEQNEPLPHLPECQKSRAFRAIRLCARTTRVGTVRASRCEGTVHCCAEGLARADYKRSFARFARALRSPFSSVMCAKSGSPLALSIK